jgi:hypothetical protein
LGNFGFLDDFFWMNSMSTMLGNVKCFFGSDENNRPAKFGELSVNEETECKIKEIEDSSFFYFSRV